MSFGRFNNDVVAGKFLIRDAIRSPNYVAGSAGWTINKDGTAEFSSATIRGLIDVGPALKDIKIVTGSNIPSELTAFYNVGPASVTAAILWYYGGAANTYHYYAIVDLGGGVPPGKIVRGDVLAGTLVELDIYVGANYTVQRTADHGTDVAEFYTGSVATTLLYNSKVAADNFQRFTIQANGKQAFGPGNAAADTNLYRSGVGSLVSDGNITANGGALIATEAAAGTSAIIAQVTGDTNGRLIIQGDGRIKWGTGAAATDTAMFRSAAAELTSDDIKARISGATETWHAMTLLAGWTNFGGAFVTAQYRRVISPADCIQIVGVIAPGTKTDGTVIATLPAGYRPLNTVRFPVAQDGAAATNQRMDIGSTGNISVYGVNLAGLAAVEFNEIIPLDA